MSTDLLGPASAPYAVTDRPAETRTFGGLDTFFKDCSSSTAEDGTDIQAAWLNAILVQMRSAIRGNGNLLAGTPVVAENNADDALLLKAIQFVVQRGQVLHAIDTGTANHIIVTVSPAPVELKAGMVLRIKVASRNTGPTDVIVNGLAAVSLFRRDGTALQAGDLLAGCRFDAIVDDTLNFRLLSLASSEVPRTPGPGGPVLYVRTDGNDNNDGSANDAGHAFATINAALAAAANRFNLVGRVLTIQLGNTGTYAKFAMSNLPSVQVVGNVAAQDSYIIAGDGVVSAQFGNLSLVGLTLSNTGTGQHTAQAAYGGQINLQYVTLASLAGLTAGHMTTFEGGGITLSQGIKITGNAGACFMGFGGGFTLPNGTTLTLVGSPAFAIGFLQLLNATRWAGNASQITITGAATGARFNISLNSTVNTGGGGVNYLPGSTPGVNDGTAVYA